MRISDWSSDVCSSDLGCDSSVEKSDIYWLGAVNLCPIIARKLSKINVNYRQYMGENRQTLANQLLAPPSQSATGHPPTPQPMQYTTKKSTPSKQQKQERVGKAGTVR